MCGWVDLEGVWLLAVMSRAGVQIAVMRADAVPSSLRLAGGVVWYGTVVVLYLVHTAAVLCATPPCRARWGVQ